MSITLNATKVQSFGLGGVEVESNTSAAVTTMTMDFQGESIRITLSYGTIVDGKLAPGPNARPLTVRILTTDRFDGAGDLIDPGRIITDAGTTISLTAGQRTAVLNIMSGLRNQVESFLLTKGVTDGTQVAW